MMKKVYRTALGKYVDMDRLRLTNEDTIAVGNMRVNARGDELGFGGEVVRTRNEVMRDYYNLTTPTVEVGVGNPVGDEAALHARPTAQPTNLRGSLADSIAKQTKFLDDPDGEK
jgi:hypothetical protein